MNGKSGTVQECNRPMLSVVIPACNEEGAVHSVITGWVRTLTSLTIDYEMLLYDDGSRDATGRILRQLAEGNPRIKATSQPNRGHGPTLMRAYQEAKGDWVFQVDADGEMHPDAFEMLWGQRNSYDVLFGCRADRRSSWDRKFITRISRWTVRFLFGKTCSDVNTPYRLMRRTSLQEMLPGIGDDTFAPNLIIAGIAGKRGLRIFEHSVRTCRRRTGRSSLIRWGLWRAASRSFCQTVTIALKEKKQQ